MKETYGRKFRKLRKATKISSSKAAEAVGISRSKLERWERGEAGLDIEKVFKLLEVIHVPVSYTQLTLPTICSV